MEVILKKAKVTSSVLNQTVSVVSLDNFEDFEPLGWVLHAKERWLIFHKDGLLVKVVYSSVLSLKSDWEQIDDNGRRQMFWYIEIKRFGNRYDTIFKFSSEEEAVEYKNKYEQLIKNCKIKGQFYI